MHGRDLNACLLSPCGVQQEPAHKPGTVGSGNVAVLWRLFRAQVGSSKGLRVGQSVYALGNPRGLSRTLTSGVVSGLNRAIPSPANTLTYGAIQASPITYVKRLRTASGMCA